MTTDVLKTPPCSRRVSPSLRPVLFLYDDLDGNTDKLFLDNNELYLLIKLGLGYCHFKVSNDVIQAADGFIGDFPQ